MIPAKTLRNMRKKALHALLYGNCTNPSQTIQEFREIILKLTQELLDQDLLKE